MGGRGWVCAAVVGMAAAALVAARPAVAQRPALHVTSYAFSILIPDTGANISALASVSYRAPTADTLRLNLVGLTVDSVRTTQRATPYSYDGQILRVPVGPSDSSATIQIIYHGIPRDGLFIGTDRRGRRVAFADNWPERARYWLPVVDRPAAKAAVSFHVDMPASWRAIANGDLVGCNVIRIDHAAGFCDWHERWPIPAYTMVVGAGRFTVSRHRPIIHGSDTIPITVWTYPEDSAFADSFPFRRATEIVEVMQRLIAPFPYEKLAHVQSSTKFGGMENSSAIFYAEKPYVDRRMGEGVVRHETAHQWFGDAVTEPEWAHLWLSEGFASYFDLVIGAALDGD